MADATQKPSLSEESAPYAIESDQGRQKRRSSSKRPREGNEREHQRSKQSSSRRSQKPDSNHRQKSFGLLPSSKVSERPRYELEITLQPPRSIVFGTPVETSALVSMRVPSAEMASAYRNYNTANLMAIVSLVADTRNGETTPLQHGSLTSQTKLCGSAEPVTEEFAESVSRHHPCQIALGYFSFPELDIRQTGTYRIRTTLCSATADTSSIIAIADSEVIKVERSGRNRREP